VNRLQQEIKDFHEQLKPILRKILEQYNARTVQRVYKNVIMPCKHLLQKCSFKSKFDTGRLCALAYWLYIYDYKQLALEICELTHDIDFDFEYGYSGHGIIDIYGLEIRIAREILGEKRHNIISSKSLDFYLSKLVKKSIRYPQILRDEEISSSIGLSEHDLLSALYDMIGKGETGLYAELNENWTKIEQTIIEYIDLSKQ